MARGSGGGEGNLREWGGGPFMGSEGLEKREGDPGFKSPAPL